MVTISNSSLFEDTKTIFKLFINHKFEDRSSINLKKISKYISLSQVSTWDKRAGWERPYRFQSFDESIVYKKQIEMNNFIQVPASLVFAAISEYWFSWYSRLIMIKLMTEATAFLRAFLIKINNKKLYQIISELLTLSKYFMCSLKAGFQHADFSASV